MTLTEEAKAFLFEESRRRAQRFQQGQSTVSDIHADALHLATHLATKAKNYDELVGGVDDDMLEAILHRAVRHVMAELVDPDDLAFAGSGSGSFHGDPYQPDEDKD